MKQFVILAGGLGTRIQARLADLPKPMIPIGNKPLLEIQLELARRHGFAEGIIFACHRADIIERHCGDGSRWGMRLRHLVERQPLGTAGAVLAGFEHLSEHFVVLYGDTMINVDLDRLWRTHLDKRADVTLLLHPNDHPLDSDLVETDAQGWVTAFHHRPHRPDRWFKNLVNAGLYVVRKQALAAWAERPVPMDFANNLFPELLRRGGRLLSYPSPEYIKDIGTPERYDNVCVEYASGLVERSSFTTPRPAVFLDRDGTLNKEIGGVLSPDQLELLPGVAAAIRELNHHGWCVVVVTNQPIVAKGFCCETDVESVHMKLETLLGREHAFLDRIYWCPHHPEKGFAGERPELKMECACRKPKPGMIHRAAIELNLDIKSSWLVGDTDTDMETARNANLQSVRVCTGHMGGNSQSDAPPGFVCENLMDATRLILAQAAMTGTSSQKVAVSLPIHQP